jgi:hypothetical protein
VALWNLGGTSVAPVLVGSTVGNLVSAPFIARDTITGRCPADRGHLIVARVDAQIDGLRFADLDPEVRTRELSSLQEVLTRPLTRRRLSAWIGQSRLRRLLLAGSMWGTIRWKKSLGRPLAPSLAAGFAVEHRYFKWHFVVTEAGPKQVGTWLDLPAPALYDLPDSGDEHRVGIMSLHAERFFSNHVTVRLAPGGHWDHPFLALMAGYKRIEPAEQHFSFIEEGAFVMLQACRVVHVVP